MELDESEWPIRHTYKKEGLEGEVPLKKAFTIQVAVKVISEVPAIFQSII